MNPRLLSLAILAAAMQWGSAGAEPLQVTESVQANAPMAAYRLCDMRRLQLDEMSRSSPSHCWGYVDCGSIQDGERLHPCRHDAKPHDIKIYIGRTDNAATFDDFLRNLDPPQQ